MKKFVLALAALPLLTLAADAQCYGGSCGVSFRGGFGGYGFQSFAIQAPTVLVGTQFVPVAPPPVNFIGVGVSTGASFQQVSERRGLFGRVRNRTITQVSGAGGGNNLIIRGRR